MNGPNFGFELPEGTKGKDLYKIIKSHIIEDAFTVSKKKISKGKYQISVQYHETPDALSYQESVSPVIDMQKAYKRIDFVGTTVSDTLTRKVGSVDIPEKSDAQKAYDALSPEKRKIVDNLMYAKKGEGIPIGAAGTLGEAVGLLSLSQALKKEQ